MVTATPTLGRAGQLAFVDLDDTVGQTFGDAEQGAGRDYSDVKGRNALIATRVRVGVSSVIAATGLRQLLADALATAHHLHLTRKAALPVRIARRWRASRPLTGPGSPGYRVWGGGRGRRTFAGSRCGEGFSCCGGRVRRVGGSGVVGSARAVMGLWARWRSASAMWVRMTAAERQRPWRMMASSSTPAA
ncbi:hypothetical protein [Pseudonocardia ammonioxydans]|uniref:hypothetical protein n=1 Tax=Pseudonocardia ammonioxydans TaxID=260086 RepID=UPI000B8143A1|nr:hypothetical protein [Pseudonocardia ammonioxydans]